MNPFILTLVFLIGSVSLSAQSFRFLNLDLVLSRLPAYQQAQKEVDSQAKKWRESINEKEADLKRLREEFILEKDLLDEQLIQERQLYISQKEKDLLTYQNRMFGSEGEIIRLRKRLIKPIQDMIYNKVQEIVRKDKIDVVFYQSKDNMVAIYYNKNYDISSKVINQLLSK